MARGIQISKKKASPEAFNRSMREDKMREQRGSGQSGIPPLSPTDDNPLATFNPDEEKSQEGESLDAEGTPDDQPQNAERKDNDVQLEPGVPSEQQHADKPTSEEEPSHSNVQQSKLPQQSKPIRERGTGTKLLNSLLLNRREIKKLKKENKENRKRLKMAEKILKALDEKIKLLRIKMAFITAQIPVLIIVGLVSGLLGILLLITIIGIPAGASLLSFCGSVFITMIPTRMTRLLTLELEIKKIESSEPYKKSKNDVKKFKKKIANNLMRIRFLLNQTALDPRRIGPKQSGGKRAGNLKALPN